MSNIILESQGIVDKYIGDAIMAFWNAPLYVEDHPIVGCGAALKYQQRLRELRTGRTSTPAFISISLS
jgi:adenylate cyclase